MFSFYIRMSGLETQLCPPFQLPAEAHPGKQHVRAQTHAVLPVQRSNVLSSADCESMDQRSFCLALQQNKWKI